MHTPDLIDSKIFTSLTEGVRYAEAVGFDKIIERGRLAADYLPNEIVYAGSNICWLMTASPVLTKRLRHSSRSGA